MLYKKKFLHIKLIICFIFFFNFNCDVYCNDFPFEKKIWTYWHQEDLQSAPMLVRQCSEHIRKIAEAAGFQYFRLSKSTVRQFITNFDEKITKVRQKSKQGGLAAEADLIRFNLIYENGGIWMDITTYFPQGIDWLVEITSEKYRNIITNRYSEQPDVMLVYFQGYQNTQQYRISNTNNKDKLILYNEMPGYEAWFFAAKKHAKLIEDIRETYTYFTQLQFKEMVDIFIKEDIYMNNVDFGSYLTVDMAACYTLQKKQFQLDQQMTRNFSERKIVYEHYKLWSLSAILGPLFWTRNQNWAVNHMIQLSKQEYDKQGYMVNFFVKNLGWFSSRLQQKMNRAKQLFYEQKLTFQQFLQSNPSENECKETVFLAEDSLLFDLLKNARQVSKGEIKPITKQEKQQWHAYCKRYQKSSFYNWIQYISFSGIRPIDGVAYRAHEIVNFDKRQLWSLRQKVENYFYERKGDLLLFIRFLVHFGVVNIVQLGVMVIFMYVIKRYQSAFDYHHHQRLEQTNQAQDQKKKNINSIQTLFYLVLIILTGTLSFHKYFMIDYFGFRDNPLDIALILSVVYLLQCWIERQCKKNRIINILYELSYVYVSYCVSYMSFCLMVRFKVRLFYYTFVVGLLGPCLLKLNERMITHKRKQDNLAQKNQNYLNIFLLFVKRFSDRSAFRISSIIILLSLYLFPMIRYWTIYGNYIISFIPVMLSLMVLIFFIMLFYECIRQRFYRQVLNLFLLGIMNWQLYGMCVLRNKELDQQQRRIAWNIIVVAAYGMVYLQIGSSIGRQTPQNYMNGSHQVQINNSTNFIHLNSDEHTVNIKDNIDTKNKNKLFPKIKSLLKQYVKPIVVSLVQIVFYYLGIVLQLCYGSVIRMGRIGYDLKGWYMEMFLLIVYSMVMCIYVQQIVEVLLPQDSSEQQAVRPIHQQQQHSVNVNQMKDKVQLSTSLDGISSTTKRINNNNSSIVPDQQWQ